MNNSISEHKEQAALIKAWRAYAPLHGIDERLLFAIPNGGKRDYRTAKILQSEGVRSGIPDLMLAIPKGMHHGLFIEMKKKKGGVVSDAQREMMDILNALGYKAVICHGCDDAFACIISYLEC